MSDGVRGASTKMLEKFLYWIKERERIRLKRARGEAPAWTTDAILAKHRFCNVRRRDDRVSQWIRLNVILPNPRHPALWAFLGLVRMVNWPPTIQAMMDEKLWPSEIPDWDAMADVMMDIRKKGGKVWTGAFMVHGHPGQSKPRYIVDTCIKSLWDKRDHFESVRDWRSRRLAHQEIEKLPGWGSFMAGQLVDDWTWTPFLGNATDLMTWAPLGPGSTKGLNLLFHQGNPNTKWRQEDAAVAFNALRLHVMLKLGSDYADVTAMDIQNCCCEFSKYYRIEQGGRGKNLYVSHKGLY